VAGHGGSDPAHRRAVLSPPPAALLSLRRHSRSSAARVSLTGALSRGEAATLKEQLHELKARVKLLVSQTHVALGAEVKILLTKVDAAYGQIAQLEQGLTAAHSHIGNLQAGKRALLERIGLTVPASELDAAKAESGKLRGANDELSKALHSTQAELEQLRSTLKASLGPPYFCR
jgi:hypothetical protein